MERTPREHPLPRVASRERSFTEREAEYKNPPIFEGWMDQDER